jgi:UbiD family decarboxylase
VTQDLEVPADAEFVFEGEIATDAPLVDEGPFGEYAGYSGLPEKHPEMRITALTSPTATIRSSRARSRERRRTRAGCSRSRGARR